jgi:hypothetical protein
MFLPFKRRLDLPFKRHSHLLLRHFSHFKITNHTENHHGFQYKTGLNILKERYTNVGAVSSLSYTTLSEIHRFYDYGCNLREVTIPTASSIVSTYCDCVDLRLISRNDGTYGTNKMILGAKYSLFDPNTYKLFNLDMTQNTYIVDYASEIGNIEFLEYWLTSKINLHYSENAMDLASKNNHLHILSWWLSSKLELKYSNTAMTTHHVDVLEWWKTSGLALKYNTWTIDCASASGRIDVLTWWSRSKLPLLYSTTAIYLAAHNKHTDVLYWWLNSGLECKYYDGDLRNASALHSNIIDHLLTECK